MKIRLNIEASNDTDAYNGDDGGQIADDVARVVRDLLHRNLYHLAALDSLPIRDTNGNKVGRVTFESQEIT